MSIVVECPNCRATAQVPDSAEGAKGKCRSCGWVVSVPGGIIKRCSACSVDVGRAKRWKDTGGHYFCDGCWHNRHQQVASDESDDLVAALESLAVSTEAPVEYEPPKMPCGQCGTSVPLYQLKRTGERHLCLSCYSNFALNCQAAPDSWTTKTVKKPRADSQKQKFFTTPGLIMIGLLIVAGVVAIVIKSQESGGRVARYDSADERPARAARVEELRREQATDAATDSERRRNEASQIAEARRAEERRREEAAKAEREQQEIERPARESLLAYALAKVDLDEKAKYAKSLEELSQSVAENMSATGRSNQSKFNKAMDDALAANDAVQVARQKCLRCLRVHFTTRAEGVWASESAGETPAARML